MVIRGSEVFMVPALKVVNGLLMLHMLQFFL
jgi:hypothetical protein